MPSARSRRLAYLLYDVGTIANRTDADTEDGTPEPGVRSADFLRERIHDEDAAKLVETAHATDDDLPNDLQRETQVLRAADRLATPTVTNGSSTAATRLSSVFTSLLDTDSSAAQTYPLRPLSLDRDVLFPRPRSEYVDPTNEGYQRLWNGLENDVSPEAEYETIVHLLEKYGWCVPSEPETPTLPLSDRLHTAAAIGEALHRGGLPVEDLARLADGEGIDGDLFTLVKGDVSGIQAFLHRMRNPDEAQDRVSKRMRGRSTQLWLLNKGLDRLFLRYLDLPVTNMIWSGGGQFYALIPPSSETAIREFEADVNEWLLDRFDGDLFFVLGQADARDVDPDAGFVSLFRRVASDTDERKLRKGSSSLAGLDSPILDEPTEPCAACGGDKERDADRCRECTIQEELGRRLPRTTHLGLDFTGRPDAQFTIELSGETLSWRCLDSPEDAECVYALNTTEMPRSGEANGFVFTGAKVPVGGAVDRVWSFNEQAGLGRSDAEYLHMTKMDIDGLGNAIATGMEGGLSRLAALSRSLELFFSGYVNELADRLSYSFIQEPDACEECREKLRDAETRQVDHRRGVDRAEEDQAMYFRPDASTRSQLHDTCVAEISPIYIGFSGGDDMFFVGPWDDAIRFGRTVRETFEEYTSGALTLSAGFFLTRSTYPIGRGSASAEERLDAAKEFSYMGDSKNAASLFGETLGWELDDYPGMNALVDLGQRFEELRENEQLSQSLIHSLLDLRNESYRDHVHPSEVSIGTHHEWKFKYLLARNTERAVMDELETSVPQALPWITVPVSWASLASR